MSDTPACVSDVSNILLFRQARYAYCSIAQFVRHVTNRTAYLGNFPFPELYSEVALEENACDSDSELVKITRAKSKPKFGALRFHKKSKDKSPKEPIVEKENEALTVSVARSPVSLPSDNVVEEVDTDVGESDKEEGMSSFPKVRVWASPPGTTFSPPPRKNLKPLCFVNA